MSFVAINALAPLMALLRLDRKRGDRPRLKSLERDRLAGFLAIAVSPVLDPLQSGVDLGNELALAIAGAQLDGAIGLRGSTIGKIGMILAFILQMLQRFFGLLENVLPPIQELLAKIFALAVVHERLFVTRPVFLVFGVAVRRFGLTVLLWRLGSWSVFALEPSHLRQLPPNASETPSRGGLYPDSMTVTTRIIKPGQGGIWTLFTGAYVGFRA